MSLLFLPDDGFKCLSSGRCCHADWKIQVSETKWNRLRAKGLTLPVITDESGNAHLARSEDRCAMLLPNSLCHIHAEAGAQLKPMACRLFPYLLTPIPQGICVSLSFLCPTVRSGLGPPLATQTDQIRQLAQESLVVQTLKTPFVLHEGFTTGWSGYLVWEAELLQRLRREEPAGVLQSAARGLQIHAGSWGSSPIEECFQENEEAWSPGSLTALVTRLETLALPYLQNDLHDGSLDLVPRYLSSLIHRKFLLRHSSIFEGLKVLSAVLAALNKPSPSDHVAALEMVLTHDSRGTSLLTQNSRS